MRYEYSGSNLDICLIILTGVYGKLNEYERERAANAFPARKYKNVDLII
jgi:hypothetical protein